MDLLPVSYYKERIVVLSIASLIIFGYFMGYWLIAYFFDIITPKLDFKWPVFIEIALILLILVLCILGNVEKTLVVAKMRIYAPSPLRSLTYLIVATVLLIFLISLPIFLIGGAINSSFSNILVTMCGLTVIVTNSWKIRITIVSLCVVLYVLSTYYYFDITINKPTGHKALQIFAILLSLGVTVFLSWRGNFSIFDDGTSTTSP